MVSNDCKAAEDRNGRLHFYIYNPLTSLSPMLGIIVVEKKTQMMNKLVDWKRNEVVLVSADIWGWLLTCIVN